MAYPCREEVKRFQEAWEKLEEIVGSLRRGILARVADYVMARGASPEIVRRYCEFLQARYRLRRCIFMHYVR